MNLNSFAGISRNLHSPWRGCGQCARAQHSTPFASDLLWRNRRILKRFFSSTVFILVLLFSLLPALAQSPSAFPVDISCGPAPQPVTADGQPHLLYELHLTNFSASPIELLGLDVLGNSGAALASYRGEALEKLLVTVGAAEKVDKARAIGAGRTVLIFLDVTLDPGIRRPTELRHRLSLSIPGKNGQSIEQTVNGAPLSVIQAPALVLRAPLRGSGWVVGNGLGSPAHRRSFVPIDGKERIAQRYAIDYVRLGPDGRLFKGKPDSNAAFYGYGAEVLAVADAQVSGVKDGLPEYVGSNAASSRNITLDNVAGNYVILDLGHGRFALYGHLQPGSIRVKAGDKVQAGDVLALLGNSGNSDAPHLHFHVMDGDSPLGAEGVPYEINTFAQVGVIDLTTALDSGEAWQPKANATPAAHRLDFPVDSAVVTFP